jgi:sterol desaturase/sphingolipid hydroxylase (fatty acid hydroxylase superfamily)
MDTSFLSSLGRNPATSGAAIFAFMGLVALLETAIPLYARGRWNRAHLAPNLALTLLAFATSALFNSALVVALAKLEAEDLGVLRLLPLGSTAHVAAAVLVLDFSFYVAHVAMHKIPLFWRFHSVHHADPAVDVTTTIRQHPVEAVIRYAFMGVFAVAIGASPTAFAVYRISSALNALPEHANVRAPFWLDQLLSLFTTWPNVHKLHHSRDASETDTNYGNLFSFWDRLFLTFTRPQPSMSVRYGLDGFDDPARQTTLALLVDPFRRPRASEHGPCPEVASGAAGSAVLTDAASGANVARG